MRRREFFKTVIRTAAGIALWPVIVPDASANSAAPDGGFLLSEQASGRATAYAQSNKIITVDGKTHVAWQDSAPEGFRTRIRTLDRKTGEWSPTFTVGEGYDNHGGPALTVDSKGYLHIAYYPHHHPFRYRKSARPNDASEWGDEVQIGQRCTYPTLICGHDDTIYLVGRVSGKEPWVANLYRKPPDGEWQEPVSLLRAEKTGYAQFQTALAWGPNYRDLHLSCRIYDDNRGHTVGYMRSPDSGKTWERSDGTPIELPANAKTLTAVADQQDGLGSGSIAVDASGTPYVLYSSSAQSPSGAFIAWLDRSGKWRHRPLLNETAKICPGCGLSTPGALTISPDGRIFAVLSLSGAKASTTFGDPSSEIAVFEASGIEDDFKVWIASGTDDELPNWLPSLERPTGRNRVDAPGLIYTAGARGKACDDILSNKVYWVELR